MAFDPSKPAYGTEIASAELRTQFTALMAYINDLETRLNALPGLGSDAFVSAAGNDATAAMGDPARPFRTAQAAFDAALALPGDRVLRFGAGYFGGIVLAADWPERISLAGAGATVTRLGGINGAGVPGANGTDETSGSPATAGGPGGKGVAVRVATDGLIDLGNIDLSGGTGGNSGQNLDGTYPPNYDGAGGNGGVLELTGAVLGTVNVTGGSQGLPPGNGPINAPGNAGTVTLLDCRAGDIEANGGPGFYGPGAAGTVTLTRCLYTSVTANPAGTFNDTPTAPGSGVSSNVVR